ncbi:uncharacterized protein C16orf95 homolog isoform 4-T4 [Hipposideros larvatus]
MGMRPHPKKTTMLSLPAGGLGAWMLCRQHPPSPVFSSIFWMCPAPSAIHEEPMCCECQAKFRGHLPVPRTQAALPYWVPQTLRPQKQIQKTIRVCIPKVIKTCLCRCHCFEGRLPMPKYQATMPYWVPQVLRSHKKKPPGTHAPGTTAGGSAAMETSSSSGSGSRPFIIIGMGHWPPGGDRTPRPSSCPSASCPSSRLS